MEGFAALAALLTAASVPTTGTYEHDEAAIVLVRCERATGGVVGSAFKVGLNTYVTAAHVVRDGACTTGGVPIVVTSRDDKRDYATFLGPFSPVTIRTTCDGYRRGRYYVARGYPGGSSYNIYTPWLAMGWQREGLDIFAGQAIPGMSGAPVIDDSGAAVGLVTHHSPARSMALRNTGFCRTT